MPKRRFWQICQGWVDATDPTRDVKLAAFGAAVVATIIWLTRERMRGPITPEWVEALKWFLFSTSLGGAVWTGVEKFSGRGGTSPKGDEEGNPDA